MGLKKFAENLEKLKKTGSMGDYQSEEAKQARATVAPEKTVKKASAKRSDVGLDVGKKPAATVKKGQDVISDKMSFGKAFRAARNEGMKTFTWRGKKYGTKLKKKEASKPAPKDPQPPAPATPSKSGGRSFVKKNKTAERISSAVSKIDSEIARLQKMQKGAYNSNRAMQIRKLEERKKLAESRTTRGASRPQPQGGETSAQIKRRKAIDTVKVKLAEQKAKLKKLEGAGGKAISEREKAKAQIAALEAQLKKMS